MGPLGAGLARVLDEFPTASVGPYGGSPLAKFIRDDLAARVRAVVPGSYAVEGSAGRGRWGETPWVAVFDPLETDSAQHGVYIVFLFRSDGQGTHLTLGQGATAILNQYGTPRGLQVLAANAQTYHALIDPADVRGLHAGAIDLSGAGSLTRGYEVGAVASQYFERTSIPAADADIVAALDHFRDLYAQVLAGKDIVAEPPETTPEPSTEGARRRWQERIERSPKLRREAKRFHGHICKVCGFDFHDAYGPIGAGYIEAHHLITMASLKGRPAQLDPKTDFTVVCSNCHSMLHRENPPLTPAKLAALRPKPSN